ncbi:LTA synthase family protein [Helicobacter sp. 11S02596-1]|uniref:LTA synthase family protein n=1 Tax=Helicobacter sp. 11S02596-1 TaxID=1476194 RepID=UPI0015DEFA61|nr:LTA synthase family protein [Helicobacter sp. 11S02596-1]
MSHLFVVWLNYKDNSAITDFKFSTQSLLEASKDYFDLPTTPSAPLDLTSLLKRTSTNPSHRQIKHIFYIVSESFSDWAFDPVFDAIGLTSGLKSLIDNKHGFKMPYFVENGPCTIRSLSVQMTGLVQTKLYLHKLFGQFNLSPTAPGGIFHQLGYESRFFYGAYDKEGKDKYGLFDKIALIEGFDQTFDGIDMLNFAHNKPYQKHLFNEWGTHDNVMFDFVKDKVSKATQPTFNMIMTTSIHPPYDLDLKYFNVPDLSTFFDKHFPASKRSPGMDANILEHIWWYDKQVTHFIKTIAKAYPDSLFVITSDHYGRVAPVNTNDPKVHYLVPLILYSPTLAPKMLAHIASHTDITPTLIELVAPKGFVYHSFGKPFFSNDPKAPFDPNNQAFGYDIVGNEDFLYTQDFGLRPLKQMDKNQKAIAETQAKKMYQKMESLNDLSLYMLLKGSVIK